jgi:hypothetical protein
MNEKKVFYYKLLFFLLFVLFSVQVKSLWLFVLLFLGLIISLYFDITHFIKFRSLPNYNDTEILENSNKAARNSFFILVSIIMASMIYLDVTKTQVDSLIVMVSLFTFTFFVYGANYFYYKYNLESKDKERDYYLPRILSIILTCLAYSLVVTSFSNFNISYFFISLLPGTILLLISAFAWKKENLGGLVIFLLGIIYLTISMFYPGKFNIIFGIALITNGILFLITKIR